MKKKSRYWQYPSFLLSTQGRGINENSIKDRQQPEADIESLRTRKIDKDRITLNR